MANDRYFPARQRIGVREQPEPDRVTACSWKLATLVMRARDATSLRMPGGSAARVISSEATQDGIGEFESSVRERRSAPSSLLACRHDCRRLRSGCHFG